MNGEPEASGSFWNLFTRDAASPPEAGTVWNLFTDPAAPADSGAPATSQQAAPAAQRFNEQWMFWALRNLPVTEAVKHLAVIGAVGSGKTTLIQLYLQSLAPRFRPDWPRPEQLIVFDGKCDVVPLLAGLGLPPGHDHVYLLNPYDERGVAWDIAEGAQGSLMARHLATLLIPEEPRSQSRYFSDAARDLVYAVILALNKIAHDRWTFRDLICALDSPERIRAITARHARAQVIARRLLDDDKHAFGVLSTIGTKIVPFEPVAALWHSSRNRKPFRIREFLQRPGVLVLGNDPVLRDSIWPINALLLKALTQEILRRGETRQPRHWFVLDEFPAMEKVDCIHDLLRRGRSKGAAVLLGLQGLEGLIEVYQENGANDILSQCSAKTFLRVGGPKTAQWAESYFGKLRQPEQVWSESWNKEGHSTSVQYNLTERSLFLASVFLNLPLPAPGGPFLAISDVPCLGCTLISQRWFDQVLAMLEPAAQVPAVVPRDSLEEQTLVLWEPEEEAFFCRPHAAPGSPPAEPTAGPPADAAPPPEPPDAAAGLPDPQRRHQPPPGPPDSGRLPDPKRRPPPLSKPRPPKPPA